MNPITPGQSVQDLARTLRTTVDSPRDPQYSQDEFTSFLSRLLTGIHHQQMAGLAQTGPGPTAAGTAPVRFDGFDFSRAQDPQRSAKDAFAMLAREAGAMPAAGSAEQWFAQKIAPGMDRLGHKIDWVQGTRFQFTNWQGTFAVDFLRGEGGAAPMLAWGVE